MTTSNHLAGVSLFAGIGGFDLAMERCGIRVTHAAEIDKACQAVLGRHFPETTIFTDVKDVTANAINDLNPERTIVTAGWPCQGNSVAGRRQGMADNRSGLWMEVNRILFELRPKWFVGENVPGLLTVNGGRDFLAVVRSLVELGYGVAWRVLDAQNFGVPQRRRRVIVVGCAGDAAGAVEVLFDVEGCGGDSEAVTESGSRVAGTLAAGAGSAGGPLTVSTLQGGGQRGYRVDAESAAGGHLLPVALTGETAYALSSHHGHDDRENTYVSQAGVRRLTPLECERLQGFPDGWTAGQSDSARYRQLGNAVAVPVVEWVLRRLVSTSRRQAANELTQLSFELFGGT